MLTEVNQITTDIDHAVASLSSWMSPDRVQKDLLNKFNAAYLLPEPYGMVLIISPWNYPLMLSLMPLTGAIAAGKCIVLCSCTLQLSAHCGTHLSKYMYVPPTSESLTGNLILTNSVFVW